MLLELTMPVYAVTDDGVKELPLSSACDLEVPVFTDHEEAVVLHRRSLLLERLDEILPNLGVEDIQMIHDLAVQVYREQHHDVLDFQPGNRMRTCVCGANLSVLPERRGTM